MRPLTLAENLFAIAAKNSGTPRAYTDVSHTNNYYDSLSASRRERGGDKLREKH